MTSRPLPLFVPRLARRRRLGRIFSILCASFTAFAALVLLLLLWEVVRDGWPYLTTQFLASFPSSISPTKSGIKSALWGSIWLVALTGLTAVPVGVAAAIYLEEYARKSRLTAFISLNIANLSGVPSIVYGLLGLAVFVRWMALGRSLIAGALTMGLLILPVIIIVSREAIAAVPQSIRRAAYALGATRWQTIWHHVLPAALPGMMTGIILSLSRAIGETAPLILIGAIAFIRRTPGGSLSEFPATPAGLWDWFTGALHDSFCVLPLQIFDWARRPLPEFHGLAAAGIIVLLAVLLTMNAIAIGIRAWKQGRQT